MTNMLDSYISANKYKSVKWPVFQAHVKSFINLNYPNADEINGKIDWETWVYGPGLAPIHLNFTTEGLTDALNLVDQYIAGTAVTADAQKKWTTVFKSTT